MNHDALYAVYLELMEHYGTEHQSTLLVDAALRYNSTEADNARCRKAAFEAVQEDLESIVPDDIREVLDAELHQRAVMYGD